MEFNTESKRDPEKNPGSLFSQAKRASFSAQNDDIRRLRAFRTFGNFELYFVAFIKRLKSISFNCGEVNEHIVSIVSGNESKALPLVEPFYMTFGHINSPPFSLSCIFLNPRKSPPEIS
ncbi:MAG: hypothetical protein A2162_03295 [Deltaproteobacteria bacterium RBG_13_52_11b]|nr:MAG: hypothetical protein A2162_03295 [Deltaproteobacteria bacterium RBG_13_52_11b]